MEASAKIYNPDSENQAMASAVGVISDSGEYPALRLAIHGDAPGGD